MSLDQIRIAVLPGEIDAKRFSTARFARNYTYATLASRGGVLVYRLVSQRPRRYRCGWRGAAIGGTQEMLSVPWRPRRFNPGQPADRRQKDVEGRWIQRLGIPRVSFLVSLVARLGGMFCT